MKASSVKVFIIGLLALASTYLLKDFIFPMLLGGIFALILTPANDLLLKKIKKPVLSSAIISVSAAMLVFFPLITLIISGVGDLVGLIQSTNWPMQVIKYKQIALAYFPQVEGLLKLVGMDLVSFNQQLIQLTQGLGNILLKSSQTLLTQTPSLLLSILIVVFSMFLALSQRRAIKLWFLKNPFLSKEENEEIIKAVSEVSYSVVLAAIVSAFLQMVLMAIIALIIGQNNILLIAVGTFLLSFVPVVGTSPITLTLIITNWLSGNFFAVVLVLIGVGGLTLIDNFLRPLLIGNKTNLHPFLAFLSALGGLTTFGFYGLFFGPILLALFFNLFKTLWKS